jgi:anthranilate phosphoribosyltransferase
MQPDSLMPQGPIDRMSIAFRELLKTIGSGPHTGENLSRDETAAATRMMLTQEATPAQIGAFMIAHRIKRPTGAEMAGMLDAYHELGPQLRTFAAAHPTTVFCHPYDGRSRTLPLGVLVALVLATAKVPTLLHGGDRIPTKYGLPLIEIWQQLGVPWDQLTLAQIQTIFEQTHLGFIYLPRHFPQAQGLMTYRDEIGKRPPFATLELMWAPLDDPLAHRICGYVHPPTEGRFCEAFDLHGIPNFTTVKGLEGSCDLPRDRTNILGLGNGNDLNRLCLNPRDHGFAQAEIPLTEQTTDWRSLIAPTKTAISDQRRQALLWNSGFFLWRCGPAVDLPSGITLAHDLLDSGQVANTLALLQSAIDAL